MIKKIKDKIKENNLYIIITLKRKLKHQEKLTERYRSKLEERKHNEQKNR